MAFVYLLCLLYISTILFFSSLGILAIIILDLRLTVGNYYKQYIFVLLELHIMPKYLPVSISKNDAEAVILCAKTRDHT